MTMRRTAGVISSLLLVLAPLSIYSLSCPDTCDLKSCKQTPPKCAYGKIKDACSCCAYCGNGPGQQCGGDFNILGLCGKGLECISNSATEPSIFPEGICVWKNKPQPPVQPGNQQQQQPPRQHWMSKIAWKKFSNRNRSGRKIKPTTTTTRGYE